MGFASPPSNSNAGTHCPPKCVHYGSVRLHHEPRRQDRAAEAADPQGRVAVVLSRRQDRRARAERLGQVHPAQDHGGARHRHRRPGHPDARPEGRLSASGAAAGCRKDGSRRSRGRPGRSDAGQGKARRHLRRVRRTRCRLRRAGRRAGQVRSHSVHLRRRHRIADGSRGRCLAPAALGSRDRHAVRRREASCGLVQASALQARDAAARRAHQPPRCRKRRLARNVPEEVSGHRGRRHPRPVFPGQRGRVDPRARPRRGHSLEGQLQFLARPEADPAEA